MLSIRWYPLQIRGYPPPTFLKKSKTNFPLSSNASPQAWRDSLPAWRKLQGRLIPSVIFVFLKPCFSHLGQEKCETQQQLDPEGLWPRSGRQRTLDLVVL